jgi:hypothetical protein
MMFVSMNITYMDMVGTDLYRANVGDVEKLTAVSTPQSLNEQEQFLAVLSIILVDCPLFACVFFMNTHETDMVGAEFGARQRQKISCNDQVAINL